MPRVSKKNTLPESTQIAIVGAGLGGLALACRLARKGKQVHVFERNAFAGGRVAAYTKKGYTIDQGPTFVLMPQEFEELFAYCGKNMQDYVEFEPLNPNYRIHYWDQTTFDVSSHLPSLQKELNQKFPGAWKGMLEFLAHEQGKYEIVYPTFISHNPETLKEIVLSGKLGKMLGVDGLISMWEHTGRFFDNEKLQLGFSFQSMYLGQSPLLTPGTYSMIPFVELVQGVWYPKQGIRGIVEGIEKLATELGVNMHYSTPIREVLVEDGRACGVILENGHTVRAESVVCNLDLPAAYTKLIPAEKRKVYTNQKINSLEYGCSAFMLYLGVKKDYPQLLHHNVFFAQDYKKNFEEIFTEKVLPTQPSLYINVPSRTNPALAPKGKHLLYVLVPVPHQGKENPIDWEKEKDAFVETVLSQMEASGLKDIRKNMEMMDVFTPADWENLGGMHLGSTFGLSPKFLQSSVFRPAQKSEEFANLYFVGASTHPGSGMPMVLISARTCEKTMRL